MQEDTMGQCKLCGKSGFFVMTDYYGLCGACAQVVKGDVQQRRRIIEDCVRLIETGKTFKTKLSRCDLLIEHMQVLAEYQAKGMIDETNPPASQLVQQNTEFRDSMILEEIDELVSKADAKAGVATTPRTKANAYSAMLLKVRELTEMLSDSGKGAPYEHQLQMGAHGALLDGYIDEARKAEFKGNTKKALDRYQEALYFVKNDDIPDEQQTAQIQELEAKIQELQRGQ